MRRLIALILALPLAAAAEMGAPKTEQEKALYSLGALLGTKSSGFYLSPEDTPFVIRGFADEVNQKEKLVDVKSYRGALGQLQRERMSRGIGIEKKKGKEFIKKYAQEAKLTPEKSGMLYHQVRKGKGKKPGKTARVLAHYEGTLIDGTVFDSSYKRGDPTEFALNGVIKCWTEGVSKIKVGGKAKLICPADTAYGDRGSPPMIPGGATLVFTVELMKIVK